MSGDLMLTIVLALLSVFMLFREISRKHKARMAGRIIASMLVVVTIFWLAHLHKSKTEDEAVAVVLTAGYSADSLNAFTHLHPDAALYCDASMDAPPAGVDRVADWKQFSRKRTNDSIHVFGEGFTKSTLDEIGAHSIIWHATRAPFYISAVYWRQQLEPGETLQVQGRIENRQGKALRIKLELFGLAMDSASIPGSAGADFQLEAIPLHRGRAVYHLLVMDGKDTLTREPVPVEVLSPRNLQVLMMAASPDFENTYLKNYLAAIGYPVTMITVTSGDKQEKQFLNSKADGNWASAAFLRQFDVIISDVESLRKTSASAIIHQLVQREGTGLIVRMDQERESVFGEVFPLRKTAQGKHALSLRIYGETNGQPFMPGSADSFHIEYRPGMQPVLQDSASNIFASLKQEGQGRLLATTLQHSFSMALSGDKAGYSRLWARLLGLVARRTSGDNQVQFSPAIPYIENPLRLQLERESPGNASLMLQADSVVFRQEQSLPFLWQGAYWPSRHGWLPGDDSTAGSLYVYDIYEWKTIGAYQRRRAMEMQVRETVSASAAGRKKNPGSILAVFLFLLLTASCAFLWTEQKMV